MLRTSSLDRLTLIAIAIVAYAGVNICHEIVGHCTMAALLGAKCRVISSTYIPLDKDLTEIPQWKYNTILVAGTAANYIAGFASFALLRTLRTTSSLRYFLWLFMSVNLFLASMYMTVAPIIKFGDSYFLIYQLPRQWFFRSALVLAGAALCWFSFRLARTELIGLLGNQGNAVRSIAWQLILPAYVTGGVLTVTSALFSPLEFKWAQLQAAGGTFGLTILLLLLPLGITNRETSRFMLARSIAWIVAGALIGLLFIGVLGPGVSV